MTVNVTCRFTSLSPGNNAKRLSINHCHCILSPFPNNTCKLTEYTTHSHTSVEGTVCCCMSAGLMTSTDCKRWTFSAVQYFTSSCGSRSQVHEISLQEELVYVLKNRPLVLQEVNETISFCCVKVTKTHISPLFVKIACRSAMITDSRGLFFSRTAAQKKDFLVASVSNTPYFI